MTCVYDVQHFACEMLYLHDVGWAPLIAFVAVVAAGVVGVIYLRSRL